MRVLPLPGTENSSWSFVSKSESKLPIHMSTLKTQCQTSKKFSSKSALSDLHCVSKESPKNVMYSKNETAVDSARASRQLACILFEKCLCYLSSAFSPNKVQVT